MNIAVDLTALDDNFSGIERYALNMTVALLEKNTENNFILIFKNKVFPDFLSWQNKKQVQFCVLPGCSKLLFNQWRLPRYLNHLKADYYLFFAFPMPLLMNKKHVLGTIHDMGCWDCPDTMKKQMVWYFRLSYLHMAKEAERIITISEFSKSRIQEILQVSDEKVIVAYCGLSEAFQKKAELRPEQMTEIRRKYHLPEEYYLCLSTLEPRKNMLFLLKNYLELYQSGKVKTKLVLAGRRGWKIEELLAEADAEKSGQVAVTGFVEEEDLPAVYQMAKCFIFPSVYEGFGIPPLEAMSQGVPVISSDASSMPEVLGDAVVYFHNNNAESLKKAILKMEDGMEKESYIQKGAERCRRFRYETEVDKLEKNWKGTC